MDAIQRAVVAPQVEIVEKCAARRQIFRDRTPLASCAQNIHDPVHHFAHLDMALVAATLGGRDQWFDMRPFIVGQVTRISQFAAVVTSAVLRRPHRWCPSRIRSPLLITSDSKDSKCFRTDTNRDSPDESQTGINVRVFPALLQDRREVLTASSISGNPSAWSRV